jgi:hypothetical protein
LRPGTKEDVWVSTKHRIPEIGAIKEKDCASILHTVIEIYVNIGRCISELKEMASFIVCNATAKRYTNVA